MKTFFFIIALVFSGCASQEMLRVRQMPIQDVDITNIRDGDYNGAFSYGVFDCEVKTIVRDHKIEDIVILENSATRRAKRAEGVIPEILKQQTPNVDAISGATTTSKALMKAVENSLTNGPAK